MRLELVGNHHLVRIRKCTMFLRAIWIVASTKLSVKTSCIMLLAPGGKVCSARSSLENSGSGRRLALGSGKVHGWWITCDDMSGEVHIKLLSRGDTSKVSSYVPCSRLRDATCGEVWGWRITCVGLRAGRSVEQDYEWGGYKALGLRSWPRTNSPFLFVYGDDRVIRYTGADVDTGDAEDAQATK
ncbi:hypothetical protein DEO72_LG9g1070 [Vigna unguiculata]|uniref:Uncharacterized protein n=1 Tax=Vigna unguiculata TaxID=3917 RepID=A0A4D6MZM4_VIGUN|nr:hypothetical protein DEO72_LG9g1070 [Vigna unguiculata]